MFRPLGLAVKLQYDGSSCCSKGFALVDSRSYLNVEGGKVSSSRCRGEKRRMLARDGAGARSERELSRMQVENVSSCSSVPLRCERR